MTQITASRDDFEAAYAAHWGAATGTQRTAAELAKLRDGDEYGDRAHLNGMWAGWQLAAELLAASPIEQPAAAPINEPTIPAELHHDTAKLVRRFARALANKLLSAQRKYGYSDNWMRDDWADECRAELMRHIQKGDPRDVAAYCAFLWHHNESTTPAPSPADERAAIDKQKMIASAREHGMDLGDNPVAYEFYNKATGHAIVDYTRWTHRGHLTEEAGYEARPLIYARAASAGEPGAEGAAFTEWCERFPEISSVERLRAAWSAVRSPAMAAEPTACKGKNCGSLDPRFHSAECFEEYEKTVGLKPAQADARVGLTDEQRTTIERAISEVELCCQFSLANELRALLDDDRA